MRSRKSVELFKRAATEIPGYGAFLKREGRDPDMVKTLSDFSKVPLTSKKNYLKLYEQKDLTWENEWWSQILYCSTSGSTGLPHYFPRNRGLAEQASYMAEEFLQNSSYGKGRTLIIIGFGMGVWIGGIFTMQAFEIAAERIKQPVAILPTGYNLDEVFKALRMLSPGYDQTIIAGYPPFIKEIVDEAADQKVNLKKLKIRFVFAAEAFTEMFRDYVSEKAGVSHPIVDTMNIYGSADIGAMAHETPLSILIRRIAMDKPALFKEIFGQIEKTPTFAQYYPNFIDFEMAEDQIVLTANSAIPLIRYAIGDHGGVLSYQQLNDLLQNYDIDLAAEASKAGIELTKRPFVFVYERTDFSTNLHGINIFPEFIKAGLANNKLSK